MALSSNARRPRVDAATAGRPAGASRWVVALLVPHMVLGAWLVAVPDHRAFAVAQAATLAHVGLASVSLPVALVWIARHVRRRPRSGRPARGAAPSDASVLVVALAACATGLAVVWGGDITLASRLHAIFGLGVAVPLAWHLWLARATRAATATIALLATTLGVAAAAPRILPPAPAGPASPAFAYRTRPASLYEPASDCGECHAHAYEEWKHSTHARNLDLANVKQDMSAVMDGTMLNLAGVGTIVDGHRQAGIQLVSGVCRACHAPVGFYGDDARSAAGATGTLAEGVTCTVCHTLRDVDEPPVTGHDPPLSEALAHDEGFIRSRIARMPQYVSAPETVRRYFGQGSDNPLARRVARWLTRWRPSVHKADYHSPILDSSRACEACHSLGGDDPSSPLVYVSWQKSAYDTKDAATTVTCQDCHMTSRFTGGRVTDPERFVPWGPVRGEGRSHLFLGGNVLAALQLHDDAYARLQHAYNERAFGVHIAGAEMRDGHLDVTVAVRSEHVGHNFPALESQIRYGWVQVKALDATGQVVAATPPPRDASDVAGPSPVIMAPMTDPGRGILRSGETLDLHARVALGEADVPRVARVVAELHHGMDPEPFAAATLPTSLARQ